MFDQKKIGSGYLVNKFSGETQLDEVKEWVDLNPDFYEKEQAFLDSLDNEKDFIVIGSEGAGYCDSGYSYIVFKEESKADKFAKLNPEIQMEIDSIHNRYYYCVDDIMDKFNDLYDLDLKLDLDEEMNELRADYSPDINDDVTLHYQTNYFSSEFSPDGKLKLIEAVKSFYDEVEKLISKAKNVNI